MVWVILGVLWARSESSRCWLASLLWRVVGAETGRLRCVAGAVGLLEVDAVCGQKL